MKRIFSVSTCIALLALVAACSEEPTNAPSSEASSPGAVTQSAESSSASADLAAKQAKALEENVTKLADELKQAVGSAQNADGSQQAISDAIARTDEPTVLAFLVSGRDKLDAATRNRIAYFVAKSAFQRFGTAQSQFYYALFTQRGVGVPKSNSEAIAILDQPATGESRDNYWLRAQILLAGPDAEDKKPEVRQLLEKAVKLGSGEAQKILDTL